MVAGTPLLLEWKDPDCTEAFPGDRVRCIQNWLECSMSRKQDRRPVVTGRTTILMAYELLGNPGCLPSCKMFCQRQKEPNSSAEDGQYDSSHLHEQIRWNNVTDDEQDCQRPVDVVHEERYHSHLLGILNSVADEESWATKDGSDWMLNPRIFSKIRERMGSLEVDLFASCLSTQLARFFSWRPDPEAEAVLVEVTNLVPQTVEYADTLPTESPQQEGHNCPNSSGERAGSNTTTVRVDYLRQRFQGQSISTEGTALLLASWRQKIFTN